MVRASRCLGALVALMLGAAPAVATEVVGRATIEGRTVLLYENGVWRYEVDAEPRADCAGRTTITSPTVPLSLCLAEEEWVRVEAPGEFETMFSHRQAPLYVGIIPEKITMSREALAEAAKYNLSAATGLKSPTFVDESEETVNGHAWTTVVAEAELSGIALTYWYYVTSGEGGAVQVVFWTAREQADDVAPIKDAVATTLRFGR